MDAVNLKMQSVTMKERKKREREREREREKKKTIEDRKRRNKFN